MTKILLVEDDKSLREIYGVRLLAEGYDIVSAGDGEEALAMAIKERPTLIISDVMMPKISGFDMLDILRSTTETRTIKVIMMTALSSDDQRSRGEQLGADRYLVKSQVGIEDVVRVVHEVLGDSPQPQPSAPQVQQPIPAPQPYAAPPAQPQSAAATPIPQPQPVYQQPSPQMPQPATPAQPVPVPQPSSIPKPTAPFSSPRPASLGERVIQPLKDNPRISSVDMNDLIDKELVGDQQTAAPVEPSAQAQPSVAAPTEATVPDDISSQLDQLIAQQIPGQAAPDFTNAVASGAPAPTAPTPVQPPAPAPQQPTPAPDYQRYQRDAPITPPPRDPQAQYRPPTNYQ